MRSATRIAVWFSVVLLTGSGAWAGTVTIIEPQADEVADNVDIVAMVVPGPDEYCLSVQVALTDLTCFDYMTPWYMLRWGWFEWRGTWYTPWGHNGPWEVRVTARFISGGSGEQLVSDVTTKTVTNEVVHQLSPERPVLRTEPEGSPTPEFSCFVNHAETAPGQPTQRAGFELFDLDSNDAVMSSEADVAPKTTWQQTPPTDVMHRYHLYTYQFRAADYPPDPRIWYRNPRPVIGNLSVTLDEAFNPDDQALWADLHYILSEEARNLTWKAYDPKLNERGPTDPPADDMALTQGQHDYEDAGIVVPPPAYGGRYHWVLSGLGSVAEKDHVVLHMLERGTYTVMQPKARNYDDSSISSGNAALAADWQRQLPEEVPDGSYEVTDEEDVSAEELKSALEEAAVFYFDGHGNDSVHFGVPPIDLDQGWVGAEGGVLYAKESPKPAGDGPHVHGPGGLTNAWQCHLAVVNTCWCGDEFQEALSAEHVDCVVGVNAWVWSGDNDRAWVSKFWERLMLGDIVGDPMKLTAEEGGALKAAADEAAQYPAPPGIPASWNRDLFTATNPNHKLGPARYE